MWKHTDKIAEKQVVDSVRHIYLKLQNIWKRDMVGLLMAAGEAAGEVLQKMQLNIKKYREAEYN